MEIGRDGTWRRDGDALAADARAAASRAPTSLFPVLHGPFGEDGTVQGVLETLDVPYVGAGVAASARVHGQGALQGPDGDAGRAAGAATSGIRRSAGARIAPARSSEVAALGLPVFVKPAHLGSSVGIVKVTERGAAGGRARGSLRARRARDRRGGGAGHRGRVRRARAAARGGATDVLVSEPGEIVFESDFYDYEAKYSPGGMELLVPARISPAAREPRRRARGARLPRRRLRRARARRLLRRRRAGAGQRAQHDARLHPDERVPEAARRPPASPYPELVDRLCRLALGAPRRGRGAASTERSL